LTRDTHLARREPYDRWLERLARGRRLQPLSHLPRRSLWPFSQPGTCPQAQGVPRRLRHLTASIHQFVARAFPRRRTAQRGFPMPAAAKSERSCFPSTGCHGVMASAVSRAFISSPTAGLSGEEITTSETALAPRLAVNCEFHIKPLVDESCREPDPASCARSATLAAPEIVPQRDLRRGFAAQSIVRLNCPVAVSPAPSVTWIVKE